MKNFNPADSRLLVEEHPHPVGKHHAGKDREGAAALEQRVHAQKQPVERGTAAQQVGQQPHGQRHQPGGQHQAQRIEAQELKESYDQRLAQASQEAARLVAQAKSQGQREYEAILEKAQRDAQRVQQQAQAELEAQRQKALADTRQQVASLALMAAAKVAQRRMDETEDQALVEEFLREAGEAS